MYRQKRGRGRPRKHPEDTPLSHMSVRVPTAFLNELSGYARLNGISTSELVRNVLIKGLPEIFKKRPEPGRQLVQ